MRVLKNISLSPKEYCLLLVLLLIEFTRGAFFLTFLPLYAVNYLGISVAAAGLAVSAHYLAETLSKGAAGWQLDRRGHLTMLIGLLVGLAALVLMKIHPSAILLLAGSAVLGLGISPVWLAVISKVAPVQLKERATRMGIIFAIWLVGGGGGPVVINFFIARDYNIAFWLLIFLWGFALAVSATLLPGAESKTGSGQGYSIKKELLKMLQNKAIKKILLPGMFLQTLTGGLLLPLLPLYAQNKIGLEPSQYGILLLIGGAAAALSFLPMGRLADRVNLKFILSAGFGISALSLAAFSVVRDAFNAYLLAALIGFSYAAVLPAWNNLLSKAVPPDRQATGWGVFSTIEGMGVAIGPAMGGVVAKYMGIQAPIIISTTLLAIMSCFYLFYPVERIFTK
ncbi:MFS transporter [Pelotomaculum terephthalicicum JT]|uniref:MFS transporter n=1 Tax=Pelotomaculum TaxID=191373 RepID=UPI0009C80F30|nr:MULTISPECIES: MFS transporter [Pelotomaculum]MCG9968094.1 MFS transporter [Pelotomaculum terephthalicicum JT]OPX85607.1 MAG: putative glycolipid permease LtaA [Pelotomaculum sp. PtaB.Bin117]OPY64021.1 MAG: putative glycolipid permease LtaA [Pelotomaculum sp. PtaU1.Bin065]